MKVHYSLKKLIVIILSIAFTMLAIWGIYLSGKKHQRVASLSEETRRAMNYEQFQDGDERIDGTNNVQFSAFFLRDLDGDGYAEKLKGTCKEVGKEDTLYMDINVLSAGHLEDAKIEIQGNNFYYNTVLPKDNELKDNYIGSNVQVLEFNRLNNGTQKTIMGFVKSGDYSFASKMYEAIGNNINNYSRDDNKVILTGKYYDEGSTTAVNIRKEITLSMDWYGTVKAEIPDYFISKNYQNQNLDIANRINESEKTINLDFNVAITENDNELLISKNITEFEIPALNGYKPVSVEAKGTNIKYSYDETTGKLTITKTAETNESGEIVKNGYDNTYYEKRYNIFNISITYSLEAYQSLGADTVSILIPVQSYYEGYNNTNNEFTTPYKSNIARATITANYSKPAGTVALVDITVGKYMYNPTRRYIVSKEKPVKIYNQTSETEKNDNYTVRWYVSTGTDGESAGLTLKETKNGEAQVADQFIKSNSSLESMEDITANIGIAFSNCDYLLKSNGWIKVYDEETDELLATFTKEDWDKYTESNPYKYKNPVKHIRVQTSETNKESALYVYNIKTLDDKYITEHYTREQFNDLEYIKSTLTGYIGDTYINTATNDANYELPYSIAYISLSNNTISTQATEKNEKIIITAEENTNENKVGWKNGTFLVKIPNEILKTEINSVNINNPNVQITSYELVEEGNDKYIKINTQNKTDKTQSYTITIDTNTTPDPRGVTVTRNYELYATNEAGADYYYKVQDIYDINDNHNTEELINKTQTSVYLVSPNSLLTNQTITNYDDKGSVSVSPQVADVKPIYAGVNSRENEATIGIQLKNNYSSDISEVLLLGKIPFEGNTYVISGNDLNSEFTTKMKSPGIIIPEELQGKVTIYYSENENPSKDISISSNGWKTAGQVTDWSKIKTYVIDFGNTLLTPQKEYVFNYIISLPNGIDFNKVSYAHHGVYFALHTDQGKYRTQTEPNKIGVRIADKYDIELIKFQKGKNKRVGGATYSITAEGEEEGKTATTDTNGVLQVNNLYAEKTYIIKEIKSPEDYELNSNEVKFVGHVNRDTGALSIEKKAGNIKGDITATKADGENYKTHIQVEDEAKAKLKIIKTEQGTNSKLAKVVYKITGYGLPETGRRLATNVNGEAILNGLKVGEEYTIEEVKAEGYYLGAPVKFKINNTNGTYTLSITEGSVKESNLAEEDSLPTVSISLEDEKIPTYNLEITKIKKITNLDEQTSQQEITYLSGAKFRLYKEDEKLGDFITDENGNIQINDLYQYVDGKDFNATYVLKETLPPDGYSKVKDITFKVQEKEGKLEFLEELQQGQGEKKYTTEGNTVKLTVEDTPSFKLTKKDGETNEVLANCKFAIYNVDEGQKPATNSKGEIIGTKETINGQEHYVVTTDSNGEITADLPEGMYKAVEVKAPEQYDLKGQTYYFGIGASREPQTVPTKEWAKTCGGTTYDEFRDVSATYDGKYYAVGYYLNYPMHIGEIELENKGGQDGYIVKYNENGEVEWAKNVSSRVTDYIETVVATSDGGCIVGGEVMSETLLVGNTELTRNSADHGLVMKLTSNGEVEWTRYVGEHIYKITQNDDGEIIAVGNMSQSTQIGSNELELKGSNDGIVVKFNSSGEIEWGKSFGGSNSDCLDSGIITEDGSVIVGGYFTGTIEVENREFVGEGSYDGIIIKYSRTGELDWVKTIGSSYTKSVIYTLVPTDNGGFIAGGCSNINGSIGDININSNGGQDGLIIKFTSNGEVEWTKAIGGRYDDCIREIVKLTDNEYVAVGLCRDSLKLGEYELNCDNYWIADGLIFTFDTNGEITWARNNKGHWNNVFSAVAINNMQEFIAVGYFDKDILINDEEFISEGSIDSIAIKFKNKEIPTIGTRYVESYGGDYGDRITFLEQTDDGGWIISGEVGNEGKIIKYDQNANIEWESGVKGSHSKSIDTICKTADGGYIAGGFFTPGNTVENIKQNNNGGFDGILIKLTHNGTVEWTKTFGASESDYITSVVQTSDGGYLVGGYFLSESIQIGNIQLKNSGSSDGMIFKLNSKGDVEWATSLGGTQPDYINSVTQTSDGGYVAGGCFNGTIHVGNTDISAREDQDGIIIKYSANGNVEWTKTIAGSYVDEIKTVINTRDGGILAGGEFSGEIQLGTIKISTKMNNDYDGLIAKFDSNGEAQYANTWRGDNYDRIVSIKETSDGGYIAGGQGYSTTLDFNGIEIAKSESGSKGIICKYNSDGKAEWAHSLKECNIQSVAQTKDQDVIVGGYFSGTKNIGNRELTSKGNVDGFIAKLTPIYGAQEQSELEVLNNRKELKITTDVKEIDGVKGGEITGEDKNPYELVKYGDDSIKEIKMTPNENYEIIGITVNGEESAFTTNADGTFTMPQFQNMTEDKHIVVTYSLKDNKITINKIDKTTRERISGATFKLSQIDERESPTNVVQGLINNGQRYTKVDKQNEITGVLGELTNNGEYYFAKQDGKLVPTNSKTWQTTNVQGATAGISSSTAISYMEVDLTGKTGQYAVEINAEVSSENNYDWGYATITQSATAPSYSSDTGRFMYISGTQAQQDYVSPSLEGGQKYYIHLGYYKDSSNDSDLDQVVVNTIKVYGAQTAEYNFVDNNGKYESTNQGENNTTCNSFIPLDLRNKTGKYNVTVNAEISSEQDYDYGYATITETGARVEHDNSTGRFIYISGNQSAKDYTKEIDGGKIYFLHLGYYKNSNTGSGDDKFTINSVNVTLSDSELYRTEVTTNSEGQAITQIPFGKYSITEISAPSGYAINEAIPDIEFSANGEHEFTIEDESFARIVVHHYEAIKNPDGTITYTQTELADDENLENIIGEKYSTTPNTTINKYTLLKDKNGKFVIPSNAIGTFTVEDQEVNYYYEKSEIPLTVHHYIEGTSTQVPLKNGGTAEDVTGSGKEGENYTTLQVQNDNLLDNYELVLAPENANGTYESDEVIVTYYYREITRNITLIKYAEDGTTPLPGATFEIKNSEGTIIGEYTTDSQGKINVTLGAGTYKIKETHAPDGYKLDDAEKTITITRDTTEEPIQITNEKIKGTVTVHYYVQNADGTPTTTTIKLANGSNAQDLVKNGNVGDIYATQPHATPATYYELVNAQPANSSGEYIEGNIEVIYYYKLKDYGYTVEYYYDNVKDNSKTEAKEAKYGTQITTYTDKIVDGYRLDKTEKLPLTVSENPASNIIKIYYVKRNDLQYTVNYLEKGTNKVIKEQKTVSNKTFGEVVTSANEVASINGYDYNSVDKNSITIQTDNTKNVINIYYTKKDANVVVKYKDVKTNEEISEKVNIPGKVGEEYTSTPKTIEGYTLVGNMLPANANGTYTEDEITVEYYYVKDTKVTVKYIDLLTGSELTREVVINGHEGDNYETEQKVFNGYTFVRVEGTKAGIMPKTPSEVRYYYVHDSAGVEVNYLDAKTNEQLAEQDIMEGHEGDSYTTSPKNYVEGNTDVSKLKDYDLVESRLPENANGTMTINKTVVNYYYAKKTNVVVKYKDINTGEDIITPINMPGHEGDDYDTETKDFENYVLIEVPTNKNGKMGPEETEVTYYYAHVSAGIIEKHFDEYTGELLDSKTYTGNEGDRYTTSSKMFTGYELNNNRLPSNATGTMTRNVIEVDYYYNYNTEVETRYIDKNTNQQLTDKTKQTGHEGDNYTTEEKQFENYTLVAVPENATGTMTKDPIVVTYYYVHDSAGVTVNHYDIKSGEKLTDEQHIQGHEGDDYTTSERQFDRYDLVQERYPQNKDGKMTIDEIKVDYYYIYKSKVTTQYIDKITGQQLTEEVVTNGHEGDRYITERKDFENYKLVAVPDNASGEMTKQDIVVTYYYVHDSAGVTVNHYDIKSGEKLSEEEHIRGSEGDDYTTSEKQYDENNPETETFKDYDLVQERYPENSNGKMKIEETYVDYYYIKNSTVIVKYVDKITGEELTEETIIRGHEGDEYETEEKAFEGYDIVEEEYPDNSRGIIDKEPTEVTYYYKKKTKVVSEYLDKETNEKIETDEEINGHEKDSYETLRKQIEYYDLSEEPENSKGEMTAEEIIVTYYYKKKPFNMGIDKKVKAIIRDDYRKEINSEIAKEDVYSRQVYNTTIKVEYSIVVTNKGEIAGKAKVEENIPEGFTMEQSDNNDWVISDNKASITTKELEPGESEELIVLLTWDNGKDNYGIKENIVKIIETKNKAGFTEIDLSDNEDGAQFAITVPTGLANLSKPLLIVLAGLILSGTTIVLIKRRQNSK